MRCDYGLVGRIDIVKKTLRREWRAIILLARIAGVVELVDALDSKSSGLRAVGVRFPPPAKDNFGADGFVAIIFLLK